MCDYCDCRSHAAIASLSADHETLLTLVRALRNAVTDRDRAEAALIVDRLGGVIAEHARREEQGVFVELRRAEVDGTYVELFEGDHRHLDALLDGGLPDDAAGGRLDGQGWERTARALADLLAAHIAREESDLFPAAHQLLGPDQWDRIEASPDRAPATPAAPTEPTRPRERSAAATFPPPAGDPS